MVILLVVILSRQSTVQRVDYLNDTATAVVKGPLSQTVYRHAGTDTKDFGYLAAGENPSVSPGELSSVDRVDYSNDTATAVAKGPLLLEDTNMQQQVINHLVTMLVVELLLNHQ